MNSFDITSFETSLLEEAMQRPGVSVMRLSMEIDRQLRMILAAVGALRFYSGQNPLLAVDLLQSHSAAPLPSALRSTLSDFWGLRNGVIHGSGNPEGLALRAIDYGLRILKILVGIPRPTYIVRFANLMLFQDPQCSLPWPHGKGVILQSYLGDGRDMGLNIHPSNIFYEVGQSLSWEWDLSGRGPTWGDTWYHDPANNLQISPAWSQSLEFRGRPIESV